MASASLRNRDERNLILGFETLQLDVVEKIAGRTIDLVQTIEVQIAGLAPADIKPIVFRVGFVGPEILEMDRAAAEACEARSTILIDVNRLNAEMANPNGHENAVTASKFNLIATACMDPADRFYVKNDQRVVGALVGAVTLSAAHLLREVTIRQTFEAFAKSIANQLLLEMAELQSALLAAATPPCTIPWKSFGATPNAPEFGIDPSGTRWLEGEYGVIVSEPAIVPAMQHRERLLARHQYRQQFLPDVNPLLSNH